MTVVVLALDALDAGLVEYFDLDSLKIDAHGEMETFSHMQDEPYTPEVWATIATGKHPEEHGVTDEGTSSWDSPLVNFASRFTGHLPLGLRIKLGAIARDTTGAEYAVGETDSVTLFDEEGRVVHNWPGVANGEELASVWHIMFDEPDHTDADFERKMYGKGAGKFAWAEEMLRHNVSLAGVHIHVLDALGHAYADDEEKLREAYEWVAGWVEQIHDHLGEEDDLVILSDHGMVTTFYSAKGDRDQDPAVHSWRAYAASTFDSVPESVFDVKDWLEPRISKYVDESEELELPEEQLRQLGYIE
jgi:hypothetical protein